MSIKRSKGFAGNALFAFGFFALIALLFTACPGKKDGPLGNDAAPANLYDFAMLGSKIVDASTVEFSLYAPNADTVKVRIKDEADHAMTRSDDGIWRATVGLASPVGKKYKYLVTNEDWTDKAATDPYNLAWSWEDWDACGWSIIVDRNAYAWGDASWMAQTKPSLDELVIYELHIKDFSSHASAVTVNGVTAANQGKYAGLIESIPYLQELGVNAVELMPPSEFNDGGYSWGYNTSSFFAPESGFSKARDGNGYPTGAQVEEFKALVDAFHQAGIAVIADMVYNHIGNDQNTFWYIDNEYYFDWDDDGTVEANSGGHDSTPWGNRFCTWRPLVKKLMYDNMRYFLEDLHIDGFRFDATGYVDHAALKEVVSKVKQVHPDAIFTAEQLPNATDFKGSGIAQWGGLYHDKMKAMLRKGTFEGCTFVNVDQVAQMTYYDRDSNTAASPLERVNYFESHDENSVLYEVLTNTALDPDPTIFDAFAASKLGAINLFTAMGTPLIMAGQEFLKNREGQNVNESNGQIDWSWYTNTTDDPDRNALFDYYKGLIGMRIAHPALRLKAADPATDGAFRWSVVPATWGNLGYPVTKSGTMLLGYILNADGSILVSEGPDVADARFVVVLNFGTTDATDLSICFPCTGDWRLVANGIAVDPENGIDGPDAGVEPDSLTPTGDETNGYFAAYTVPARSGVIFQLGL